MDPQMLQQLLGGAGGVPMPPVPPAGGPSVQGQSAGPSGPPWLPLLSQALDKMANMGIPFVSDISHLINIGGGTPDTWTTLLKTIDTYGKHKQSVQGASIQGGPAGGGSPVSPPPQGNPQPPGVYS